MIYQVQFLIMDESGTYSEDGGMVISDAAIPTPQVGETFDVDGVGTLTLDRTLYTYVPAREDSEDDEEGEGGHDGGCCLILHCQRAAL